MPHKNHNKLTRAIGRHNDLTPRKVRALRRRLAEQRARTHSLEDPEPDPLNDLT